MLGCFLYKKAIAMTAQQLQIIELILYFTFLIGLIISFKFNRSREFFIFIILTLSFVLINYINGSIGEENNTQDIYLIICFLIPMNVLVFSLLNERGILSLWGGIRISFIAFQLLFSNWIITAEGRELLTFFKKDLLPMELEKVTPITEIALLAFLIAFILLIIRQVLLKSTQDIYLVGVLFSLFLILHNFSNQVLNLVFFIVSGVMLIVSVIQYSYSIAFYDELTGLPSRRALKQDMMKLGINYSIAMLDIDFFKKFNDTYGHDTGDEVLRLVASIIKDVSGGGKAYRYGGEEFTILFPSRSIGDVLPHLEELREKISKRGFYVRSKNRPKKKPKKPTSNSRASKPIRITVSIGVAQKNERNKTPDTVLKSADSALYRAKKKGRNCVSK